MLLQKNSQRRLQSSTRVELARDLHDSLAQDLVAIGFQMDLLINELPARYRTNAREIREAVTVATKSVRRELFALREIAGDYQTELISHAAPLHIQINGEISKLNPSTQRVVDELVKNAAQHSKGHNLKVEVTEHLISVSDDGQGMRGISEIVEDLGGSLTVNTSKNGTRVEIRLP
jgi:NarL family two-component system sensor histidine kinase LiaS